MTGTITKGWLLRLSATISREEGKIITRSPIIPLARFTRLYSIFSSRHGGTVATTLLNGWMDDSQSAMTTT